MTLNFSRILASLPAMLLFLATAWAAPEAEKPGDYAASATIRAEGGSAYYHLSLPLAVYLGSQSPNLADVRVFNARGEAVPYALVKPRRLSDTERRTEKLAWFPLSDARPESLYEDVVIERNSDGGVVTIRAGKMKADMTTQGVLLDLRTADWPLTMLKIKTSGGQPMQHFSLHGSKDLKNWQPLLNNGVITRLEHEGQKLVQDEITLPAIRTPYLKITWARQEVVPQVEEILATFSQTQHSAMPFVWSEAITPQPDAEGTLHYRWQRPLPVEKVDLLLPETNTLAQIRLLSLPEMTPEKGISGQRMHERILNPGSRQQAQSRQSVLANTLIYRLMDGHKEVSSTQIALNGSPIVGFSIVAANNDAGALGSRPPEARIGFVPRQLVFLARGEGPFTLVWGKDKANAANLALNTLAPQHGETEALPGEAALLEEIKTVTLAANMQAQPAGSDYRWLLWAVLVVGVLLLLGMAWKLVKG